MSRVQPGEIAFLKMQASRVYGFHKKAVENGETYHDVRKPMLLTCGHKALLRYEPWNERERPVVMIELDGSKLTEAPAIVAKKLAEEILGGTVKGVKNYLGRDIEFVLEQDYG